MIPEKASAPPSGPAAGQEPAPKTAPRFQLGIGVALICATLIIVGVSAFVTHFLWQETAKRNVLDVAHQLNNEIITGIRREVADLVERTEATQAAVAEVFKTQVIKVDDKQKRRQFYLAMLQANPHISWVSFGFPNGNFFGAQRRDDSNFRLVESVWDDVIKQARREIDYYVADDHKTYFTHSKTKHNDYYAPRRRWYEMALQEDGAIWTDVYVFASTRKPGINTAQRLQIAGKTMGVISIAIELERLSHYLSSLSVGQSGVAVILNAEGELIAFKDPDEVKIDIDQNTRPRLRKLESARHPLLLAANAALKNAGTVIGDIHSHRQFQHILPGSKETLFVTFEPVGHRDWLVATIVPEGDFLAQVGRNIEKLFGLLLVNVMIVALAAAIFSRALFGRPLARIIKEIEKVERFELEEVRRVPSPIAEITALSNAVQTMRQGLSSFGRYLPVELVQTLIKQEGGVAIGGENRTLSVLFMDVEGFTGQTEALGPRLLPYLAEYFSDMSQQIVDNRGTIDKYIGDAIMAFWGAPHYNENHAADACRAALHCLRLLDVRRVEWANQGRPQFNLRIGLNTGRVIVGNVGSNQKIDYTVLGDPVNLASRLEALNKTYGTRILIGHNTFELAKYDVITRRLDRVAVRGKEEASYVYELIAMRDEVEPTVSFDWIVAYERGLDLLLKGDWSAAMEQFLRAIDLRGGVDEASQVMIERCGEAMERDLKASEKAGLERGTRAKGPAA